MSSRTTSALSTPAALEALIARRIDFPTWLPAMLVKELRQGLRQRGFVVALFGFQVLMTLFLAFAVAGGVGSQSFDLLQGAYWTMIAAQLLVIIPARALTGLQSELDARWVDLLLLTRLTPWRVVLSKWVSLLVQAALLLIAMLPYGVARYFFGSVDLVEETQRLATLFAASGMLIAIALWCSALPKVARAVLVLPVIAALWLVPDIFGYVVNASFSPRGGMSGPTVGPSVWLVIFDLCLVLALCLTGAVRRLAPAAESQTLVTRLLPLAAFLPLPLLAPQHAGWQLQFAILFFTFIAVLELGRQEEPLESHWLTWSRRGIAGRLVGRFVQPGWASATEWVLVPTAVWGVVSAFLTSSFPVAANFTARVDWQICTLPLFVAEALLFPVLLFSWLGRHFSHRLVGYLLVFLGMTVLSLVATGGGSSVSTLNFTDRLLALLPVGSFWTTYALKEIPPSPIPVLQVVIAVGVIAGVWWRARPYRLQRRIFATAPTEAPPA